jgi:hypothetical protein
MSLCLCGQDASLHMALTPRTSGLVIVTDTGWKVQWLILWYAQQVASFLNLSIIALRTSSSLSIYPGRMQVVCYGHRISQFQTCTQQRRRNPALEPIGANTRMVITITRVLSAANIPNRSMIALPRGRLAQPVAPTAIMMKMNP